jgi:GTPase SAR1 family protein
VGPATQGAFGQVYHPDGMLMVDDLLNTPVNHIRFILNIDVGSNATGWFDPGKNNTGGCGQYQTYEIPFGYECKRPANQPRGKCSDLESLPKFQANLKKIHDANITITLTLGSWCTELPVLKEQEWEQKKFVEFVAYYNLVNEHKFGGYLDGIDFDWEGFCSAGCSHASVTGLEGCQCGWDYKTCGTKSPDELARGVYWDVNNTALDETGAVINQTQKFQCWILPTTHTIQVMTGITYAMKKAGHVVTLVPMSTSLYSGTASGDLSRNEYVKYRKQKVGENGTEVVDLLDMADGITLQWYSGFDAALCRNSKDPKACSCDNKPVDDYPNIVNASEQLLIFPWQTQWNLTGNSFPTTFPLRCQACGKDVLRKDTHGNWTWGELACAPKEEQWYTACATRDALGANTPECIASHNNGVANYVQAHHTEPHWWVQGVEVASKCPRGIDCPDWRYESEDDYSRQIKLLGSISTVVDLGKISIGFETLGTDILVQMKAWNDSALPWSCTTPQQHVWPVPYDQLRWYKSCTQNMSFENYNAGQRCGSAIGWQQWGPKFDAADIVGLDKAVHSQLGKDLAGVAVFTLDGVISQGAEKRKRLWYAELMELNKTYKIPCFGDSCGVSIGVKQGTKFEIIALVAGLLCLLLAFGSWYVWHRHQMAHGRLLLESNVTEGIPKDIANKGRAAIIAYNKALRHGKQQLNLAKLILVGQERAGKSSLLRNLTNQEHDTAETTTNGADTCIIETTDWNRLESEPMYPSKFDQGIAASVGSALAGARVAASKRQLTRVLAITVAAVAIVLASVLITWAVANDHAKPLPVIDQCPSTNPRVIHPTLRPTARTPPPSPIVPTPPPSPTGPTPPPSPNGPTPPGTLPTGSPTSSPILSPTIRHPGSKKYHKLVTGGVVMAVLFASLFLLWLNFRHRGTPALESSGYLPPVPTSNVLQRMPVDLIVKVMEEGVESSIVFSAWDFAGQRIYYSVHHLFITRGVYVVVFSMDDAQKDMPNCLEYLAFWLHSIHAHTMDTSDYSILLAGTHRDIVPNNDDHVCISCQIMRSFEGCGFWPQIVQPSDGVCFFRIDNTQPPEVKQLDGPRLSLHTAITELGQQMVATKNQYYPIRWLKILDDLQEMALEGINYLVLGLDDQCLSSRGAASEHIDRHGLSPLARKHSVNPKSDEYTAMCGFLFEACAFVRYLDLLILRPQWIVEVLFAVVTQPQFHEAKAKAPGFKQCWQDFYDHSIAGEILLAQLWCDFEDSSELLIGLMVAHDLMLEVPSDKNSERKFLVPAMLRDCDDRPDCGFTGQEPACYLVFEQAAQTNEQVCSTGRGFVPEGLWFKLLVRCACWSQHTDSDWGTQHLTTGRLQRDRARFSFGTQQFELCLHRAEHAIRLVVLGECHRYPFGVLKRIQSIVNGTIEEHFPRVEYFVALRVPFMCSNTNTSKLIALDEAIKHVQRREFGTAENVSNNDKLPQSDKAFKETESPLGLLAFGSEAVESVTLDPWCSPTDLDDEFDVYISHAASDTEFAQKVYDCLAKYNTVSGTRIRVYLQGVSTTHFLPTAALSRSRVFAPIISVSALSACMGETIPKGSYSRFQQLLWGFRLLLAATPAVGAFVEVWLAYLLLVDGQVVLFSCFVAAMAIPRVFNIYFLIKTLSNELKSDSFMTWVHMNKAPFSVICLLSVFRLDTINLTRSRIYGLAIFDAPVSVSTAYKFSASGLVHNLVGDLPKLVISAYFDLMLHAQSHYRVVTLANVVFCAYSLLYQLVDRMVAVLLLQKPDLDLEPTPTQIYEKNLLLDWMVAMELSRVPHIPACVACVNEGQSQSIPLLDPTTDVDVPNISIIPLVIDPGCTDFELRSAPVPIEVFEQLRSNRVHFPQLQGPRAKGSRTPSPCSIRDVLQQVLGIEESVPLWPGENTGVDAWNKYEAAAAALAEKLARLSMLQQQ